MRLRRTLLVIAEAELMTCNRLRIRISVDLCVYVKSRSSLYQIVICHVGCRGRLDVSIP